MSSLVGAQSALGRFKECIRPRWLKVVRKWAVSRFRLQRLSRAYGLMPPSGNPLQHLRRSDTLFVLGSGASIHSLNDDEWATIAAADSVGFNNWSLHPFVPSFFVTEPGKDLGRLALEYQNLERRGYVSAKVPILMKDLERYRYEEVRRVINAMPEALLPQVSLSWDWEINEQRPEYFRRYLKYLDRSGLLLSPTTPLLRKRATVFYLVILALRAGYRRIVLCGIDLNGTEYFFEREREKLAAAGYWVPDPTPLSAAHKTNDPEFGAITIATALETLRDEVLVRHGVELAVAFKSSGLYPMFPSYFER